MNVQKKRIRTAILTVLGFGVLFTMLFPYIVMVFTSVKPGNELFKMPPSILPTEWNWNNYAELWSQAPVATYFGNSLFITICSTAIVLLVAIPAAYYVARNRFRGRTVFLLFVLATQMLAPVAVLIGIFRLFRDLGLVDTHLALILTDSAFNLAFAVWILTGFFASIPEELEEAATIDGCSKFQAFRKVILPLAGPGIVTAAIFTFVAVWNEFVIALTLISTNELKPISVGITTFIGQYDVQWQYLFATSIIGIVPVVIMFALIEKRLVGGLTAGAIK